ncbi:hypothetical protein ALP24_200061 [Pseudomonas syringae pv. aptata]|uniref:Uncharacterized protein n=1 Tax=Pseudomonas syringae pv. aptata TaxID=83167 RepID=A0A3M5WRL0_PSEAP|nr:hypothetical protein ALP24_200061 [Pseudomonas syringae pv. aptata]
MAPLSSSALIRLSTSLKALPTVALTAPPMTRPSFKLSLIDHPRRSKGDQSMIHHNIRLKGIASISAAEKPVSAANLRAACLMVSGLQFILFDQAKIAFLQAAIIALFHSVQIVPASLDQAAEQVEFVGLGAAIGSGRCSAGIPDARCAHCYLVDFHGVDFHRVLQRDDRA